MTVLLLGLSSAALSARTPPPSLRIPLEPLDFQSLPAQVLSSGASVVTLHYADDKHLLITFNRRRLMPRIPGDPETDVDRNIDAVLLELPSGRILARTSWRLHDPGQYLWSLGRGTFLLRERDTLSLLQPLAGEPGSGSFAQHPFITSKRPIGSVLISPEGDLLTLETLDRSPYLPKPRKPSPGTSAYAAAAAAAASAGDAAAEEPAGLIQVDFFRLNHTADGRRPALEKAGTVASRNLVLIPIDAAGYLSVIDEGHAHWAFNFNSHQGNVSELSPFDSSCHPLPFLVSRSEFIAFGCRGGQDPRELGGFNLRGEEMWEQTFSDSFTAPSFSFAPSAGRFALSRLTTSSPVDPQSEVVGGFLSQTVTVYQTESGRQIFSLNCNPILRASENFALSPSGEELAVLNNGAIEIYTLPALSAKDRAAIHLAESLVPERSEAPILLGRRSPGAPAEKEQMPAAEAPAPVVANRSTPSTVIPTTTAPSQTPVAEPQAVPVAEKQAAPTQLGDAPPEAVQHRKPPTLYSPGEAPAPGAPPANGR